MHSWLSTTVTEVLSKLRFVHDVKNDNDNRVLPECGVSWEGQLRNRSNEIGPNASRCY